MTYPHNDRDSRDPRDPRNERPGDRNPNANGQGAGNAPAEEALMPEGDYPVVCIKHKIGYAGSNNEQIGIRLRITEGEYKNKTLLWYGSFTDKSEEFTVKALRALGFTGVDMKDMSSMYSGTVATAVVQHDTYQGKTRAKVAWINGADVVMKQEMNDRELAGFAARMRGVFAQYGGNSAPAKLPAQNQPVDSRAPQNGPHNTQRTFNDQRGDSRNGSAPPQDPHGDAPPPWDEEPPRDNRRR